MNLSLKAHKRKFVHPIDHCFSILLQTAVESSVVLDLYIYSSLTTPLDLGLMTVLISPTGMSGMGSSMIATTSANKK